MVIKFALLSRFSKRGIEVSLLLCENAFVVVISYFGNLFADL